MNGSMGSMFSLNVVHNYVKCNEMFTYNRTHTVYTCATHEQMTNALKSYAVQFHIRNEYYRSKTFKMNAKTSKEIEYIISHEYCVCAVHFCTSALHAHLHIIHFL